MQETVQMNSRVLPRTIELIDKIADLTHRGKGDVIDWAIEEVWYGLQSKTRIKLTPAGAEAMRRLEAGEPE